MSDRLILDETVIRRLQTLGGDEFVGEMLSIFLDQAPRRIDAALDGARAHSLDAVRRAAHSLVSTAGHMGARPGLGHGAAAPPRAGPHVRGGRSGARPLARAGGRVIDVARPSRRIAVVEDNPDNRLLVQAILEELYQLTEYASGAEALVGLRQARPDLVLLDVSMPEMDGLDVIGAIRADDGLRGLPVIAL